MRTLVTVLLLGLCFLPDRYGWAKEVPVETFFRNYNYSGVTLAPDGNYVGTLSPYHGHLGLAVMDLKTLIPNWACTGDVSWYDWASNDRLVFRPGEDRLCPFGLMAVNRNGTQEIQLINQYDRTTRFMSLLPHSTNEVLVTSIAASDWKAAGYYFPDVARMNIFTGTKTREVANPGQVIEWVTDHEGVVRAGVKIEGRSYHLLYRSDGSAMWKDILQFDFDSDPYLPVGFEADNRTLLVAHHGNEQTLGLYTFDTQAKAIKTLGFRHATADIDNVWYSNARQTVMRIGCFTERPEQYWIIPEYRTMQESVDHSLPGYLNLFSASSKDETKWIVYSYNDLSPGAFYLFDRTAKAFKKLFDATDWIHPDEMAEMKPIEYKARDGLRVHGYLTLPRGSAGKNLPMVVNPHDGPFSRYVWGFDPEVQFFANRGFAVLRMNFRGSTSYGWDFSKAGYGEWGYKEQDDIADAVNWAIKEGIADPKRICIYGKGYGGFAALNGLETTPGLYRCGICMGAITDPVRLLRAHIPKGPAAEMMRTDEARQIGDLRTDRRRLNAVSPLINVEDIKVPVLMAHGELDSVVPFAQSRDMARALKKNGKLYDFITAFDEGHDFRTQKQKIRFWKKVDQFLKANMN